MDKLGFNWSVPDYGLSRILFGKDKSGLSFMSNHHAPMAFVNQSAGSRKPLFGESRISSAQTRGLFDQLRSFSSAGAFDPVKQTGVDLSDPLEAVRKWAAGVIAEAKEVWIPQGEERQLAIEELEDYATSKEKQLEKYPAIKKHIEETLQGLKGSTPYAVSKKISDKLGIKQKVHQALAFKREVEEVNNQAEQEAQQAVAQGQPPEEEKEESEASEEEEEEEEDSSINLQPIIRMPMKVDSTEEATKLQAQQLYATSIDQNRTEAERKQAETSLRKIENELYAATQNPNLSEAERNKAGALLDSILEQQDVSDEAISHLQTTVAAAQTEEDRDKAQALLSVIHKGKEEKTIFSPSAIKKSKPKVTLAPKNITYDVSDSEDEEQPAPKKTEKKASKPKVTKLKEADEPEAAENKDAAKPEDTAKETEEETLTKRFEEYKATAGITTAIAVPASDATKDINMKHYLDFLPELNNNNEPFKVWKTKWGQKAYVLHIVGENRYEYVPKKDLLKQAIKKLKPNDLGFVANARFGEKQAVLILTSKEKALRYAKNPPKEIPSVLSKAIKA